MKTLILTIFTFCVLTLGAQQAKDISRKTMNAIDIGDMEMTSTIEIYDTKGNVRTRQISTASRKFKDCNKMMIKFLAPADVKGTIMLVYDYDTQADNQWIFMPALRKVRRILSTEKGKNFMGSEFTNADMSKPNIDDFSYKLLGKETINGKVCLKIEATPLSDAVRQENNFSKRISYIDENDFLCYKIEYFDLAGKLQRVQTISKYQKQANGKYFAFYMMMENVQNGRKSVMKIDRFQAGSKMEEAKFVPGAME